MGVIQMLLFSGYAEVAIIGLQNVKHVIDAIPRIGISIGTTPIGIKVGLNHSPCV